MFAKAVEFIDLMKSLFLAGAVVCLILACNRKSSRYVIPADLDKDTRSSFTEYLDHGHELYKEFCSSCHGIHGKGKENIPNFTNAQLDMYAAKFKIQTTPVHGFVNQLSYDELENILNFLRYRSKK